MSDASQGSDVLIEQRPAWVNDELFPFESKFTDIDGHRVHFVDEGNGPTLLLLHGNPAWSFLYRHVIAELRSDYRCVALDYPGFGLSQAASGYGFLPAEHAAVVEQFVTTQALRDITLMVQDWAGPIGLGVAGRMPERFARLVIGNTWAWPVNGDKHFERFSRLMGGPVGRRLIRRFNLFVNVLVPQGHRRTKLTKAEMLHYRAPFPDPDRRDPTWIFPREIIGSQAYLAEVERSLDRLAHLPTLIVWGEKDVAFRAREREEFERRFPDHLTHCIPDAAHYIQDDAPAEVAAAIATFMTG